jgi:phosphoribosyl 1,2-cyclic phosphodiesterase
MEIKAIASGSTGNCYFISDSKTRILIECGIAWNQIKRAINYNINNMSILISHSHNDHSKAAADAIKYGIDVYCSQETAKTKNISGHRVKIIKEHQQFKIGTFTVLPFDLMHDVHCLGYLLHSDETNEKLLFITDTQFIRYKFTGVNYIMVEANYSKAILDYNVETGKLQKSLRDRIVRTHISIDLAADFFKASDLSKVREIYLLHLSENNSHANEFKIKIEKLTGKPVIIC